MWYYIKQSIMPLLYLLFSAIIAISILCLGNDLMWLKYVLLVLNVGLYVFIIGSISYKDGQTALKTRIANDLEREQIIKTGEMRPLKLKEEYKVWKGFVFGAIACAPLIILLIIHTILTLTVGAESNGAGVIASFIYMMMFAFSRAHVAPVAEGSAPVVIDPNMYYWALLALPVIILTVGIGYMLGAMSIERQQRMIREKQRRIYGE